MVVVDGYDVCRLFAGGAVYGKRACQSLVRQKKHCSTEESEVDLSTWPILLL